MKISEYKQFYDEVGRSNGWDFSKVQCRCEGVKWHFYEEVVKAGKETDVLLDIGTGGGEKLLRIAGSFAFIAGIDLSDGMIETANRHLDQSDHSNVRFAKMDADELQFPSDFFNIVSCRHSPFDAKEVARVLKDNGIFLTQQVSEHDKYNIMETFGRGASFNKRDGQLKQKYEEELLQAGFHQVDTFEYDAVEYYQRPEDLLFLLRHTPIIPHFGREKNDFELFDTFVNEHRTDKGIRTNSKRFMIIARKTCTAA